MSRILEIFNWRFFWFLGIIAFPLLYATIGYLVIAVKNKIYGGEEWQYGE